MNNVTLSNILLTRLFNIICHIDYKFSSNDSNRLFFKFLFINYLYKKLDKLKIIKKSNCDPKKKNEHDATKMTAIN